MNLRASSTHSTLLATAAHTSHWPSADRRGVEQALQEPDVGDGHLQRDARRRATTHSHRLRERVAVEHRARVVAGVEDVEELEQHEGVERHRAGDRWRCRPSARRPGAHSARPACRAP